MIDSETDGVGPFLTKCGAINANRQIAAVMFNAANWQAFSQLRQRFDLQRRAPERVFMARCNQRQAAKRVDAVPALGVGDKVPAILHAADNRDKARKSAIVIPRLDHRALARAPLPQRGEQEPRFIERIGCAALGGQPLPSRDKGGLFDFRQCQQAYGANACPDTQSPGRSGAKTARTCHVRCR